MRLRTFAVVRLRELVRDHIDTQAPYFFDLVMHGLHNSVRANAHLGEDWLPCVKSVHVFAIVYTQNANTLCAIALNHFACDRDRLRAIN